MGAARIIGRDARRRRSDRNGELRAASGALALSGSPRRALVTGAGGFIGANLVRRLAQDGNSVSAMVRPGGDHWRLAGLDQVTTVEVDLRDADGVHDLLADLRPEWVFHLAAHGAYSWQGATRSIMESVLLGTVALVDGLVEVGCDALVNAGSSSEYGFKDHAPSEDEPIEPNSAYAVAKAAGTMYCTLAARAHGLPASTLRLYSVYGPFEDPRRLIPRLVAHGLRSQLPNLVDPSTARDFVHVDDVVDAFLLAAERATPGGTYNIGSGTQTTLGDLVELARDALEIRAKPRWGTTAARDWDTAVWVSDPTRARVELGWSPRIGLRDGLLATAHWLAGDSSLQERYRVAEGE